MGTVSYLGKCYHAHISLGDLSMYIQFSRSGHGMLALCVNLRAMCIDINVFQTMSSISSFLLAMCLHPDVQNKGQEEIDSVIGTNRLPNLEDRRSLPYVEAIYREVMRLHPPLPLGTRHFLECMNI